MLSSLAADHVQRPRHRGPLEGATNVGYFGQEGEGPYLTIWLKADEETISEAAYATYGCPSAIACGSLTCEIVAGRTKGQASQLESKDLALILGGLPEGKGHCAEMAIAALKDALKEETTHERL